VDESADSSGNCFKPIAANLEEFRQHLSLMSSELGRCGNIISGLLSFSRENPLNIKI
jgi:two-component system, NtrC family, sensor kinase